MLGKVIYTEVTFSLFTPKQYLNSNVSKITVNYVRESCTICGMNTFALNPEQGGEGLITLNGRCQEPRGADGTAVVHEGQSIGSSLEETRGLLPKGAEAGGELMPSHHVCDPECGLAVCVNNHKRHDLTGEYNG